MSDDEENENKVQQGMAEFYRRVVEKSPVVSSTKPFEVTIDVQKFEAHSLKADEARRILDEAFQSVNAPPPPVITSVSPDTVSNAGGTTVTISGRNFVSGATVKIAGIAATSVNFVNVSTLTCVTPADGLGWMTVEVTNPSGQSASLANAIQYVNFPDNFVLSGPHSVAGYQGCALGDSYTFNVTARIGTQNFNPPPGVTVYAWIGVYQDAGSCGLENPFPVTINNSTGATASRTIAFAVRAVTPGVLGSASVLFAIWASNNGGIGIRYPTYGDATYQPTSFRVDITGNAPPPPPPTGGEYFSWSGVNNNSGHFNPWAFGPDTTLGSSITIKRLTSGGAVVTTYNGTAGITFVRDNAPVGVLQVSYPTSRVFVNGVATFGLSSTFNYVPDVSNSQAFAYWHLVATDGAVSNATPQCTTLNHL